MLRFFKVPFNLVIILLFIGCFESHGNDKVGYAPPEAFEPGSIFPFYGSNTKKGFTERVFEEKSLSLYKRSGQYLVFDLVRGRTEEAVRDCRNLQTENPDDPEYMYILSMAECQLGNLSASLQMMEKALSSGFPFERFLAGPRDLLGPLWETEAFREAAARHDIQLIHGPLLGCVTDTSAVFWVRTTMESPVLVRLSRSGDLANPIESEIKYTDSKQDYTTVVEIPGLLPETTYYYDVMIDGKSELDPTYPSFRTYPSSGKKARFKVGFGGGAGYVPNNERMWDVIKGHNPVAFLFLGDNVYHDLPEAVNGLHHYTYYRRQSRPEFRRLTSSTSIYAIWDDHDSAANDVFMGPYRDKPIWKMSLFNLFRQNWNNPAYGHEDWPGTWFNFKIGDVEFFMLDGRFYRTNPHTESPTMLGPIQKHWLFRQLKASEATFKMIVSPVPWSFEAKGDSLDTWNGYREERNEIFRFLSENKVEGVALLSADRHRSDVWRIDRPDGYPLYEFGSSRLTNEQEHPVMPGSIFGYNEKQSFGLLTFDTMQSDPAITYEIYSIDDETIYTLEVMKSELSD